MYQNHPLAALLHRVTFLGALGAPCMLRPLRALARHAPGAERSVVAAAARISGTRALASAAGRVVTASDATARKARPRKAVLELTESAARRIETLLSSKQQQEAAEGPIAVRVGVRTRGCNGLSYTMNYATTKAKFEEEVNQHGVRVFVEPKALMHVIGTTMDFV
jgi:iron-sulfur cluster assembly accessory protein